MWQHRRFPRIVLLVLVLVPALGCAGTDSDDSRQRDSELERQTDVLCRNLIAAAPAAWPEHWKKVRELGDAVAPQLIAAFRDNPDGKGAQAAIHLLGNLQAEPVRPFLEELLVDDTNLGVEAALALIEVANQKSAGPLRAVVADRGRPVTTRVAAASALVALGHARSIVGFVEAVFLAASPYGDASTREHGLPRQKTRWAHERYMLIEALRRRYDGRSFGLDEDSSWPALRDAAKAMRE